jgi:hypothetical protein
MTPGLSRLRRFQPNIEYIDGLDPQDHTLLRLLSKGIGNLYGLIE